MAVDDPLNYVLKPQREGGGNNLYKERMVAKLKEMTREVRPSKERSDQIAKPSLATNPHTLVLPYNTPPP